jgi:hypothetical protein
MGKGFDVSGNKMIVINVNQLQETKTFAVSV